MERFAHHMTWVMTFLSLPLSARSVLTVDREAESKQVDKAKLRSQYAGVILKEMSKFGAEDMECDVLNVHYLEQWSTDFVELVSTTQHFEKFGSTDEGEANEYAQAMDAYWIRVKSHCVKLAQHPPKDLDSDALEVVKYMEIKIDWLQTGLLHDGPQFLSVLPVPNKYLLADIFKLYSNAKIKLDKVIIDVSHATRFGYVCY
jgi:hypothetical protein